MWSRNDFQTGLEHAAFVLDDTHVGFVAEVYLNCNTQAECDALGLTAVPFGETGLVEGHVTECLPGADPSCVPGLAPSPSVVGTGRREYFYVLDLGATGGPAWQFWGASTLEATIARTDQDSRFASPIATNGTLAATRLERRNRAGAALSEGTSRVMLDRFARGASGEPIALPPVNVPGYPVARLGGESSSERWISVEAAPGGTGQAYVHRLRIEDAGARLEQTLDIDDGSYSGFMPIQTPRGWLGLVLTSPSNACGFTLLSAIQLGTSNGDADEPLSVSSTLELPEDGWALVTNDENRVLLHHTRSGVYTLVEVTPDAALSVISSQSPDVGLTNQQLLGTSLFGGAGRYGTRRIDF
jgi:hypothetical protein